MTISKNSRLSRMLAQKCIFKKYFANGFLFVMFAFCSSLHAAERLYELTLNGQLASGRTAEVGQVSFSSSEASELNIGDVFDIALPTGSVVTGEVIMNASGAAPIQGHGEPFLTESTDSKMISLGEAGGSLEVHLVANTIAGITLNDTDNGKIYRARIDGSGAGGLTEIDPNSILCFELPEEPGDEINAARLAEIPLGLTLADVEILESRPGATNTVYIDNWGGSFTGPEWNSGRTINYTPYSYDNDTNNFSPNDISYIWLAWAEMAEDYADFDVNITTRTSVYNATSPANRSRIIATTTCAWYGNCGSGGVAYINVFNRTTDRNKTGWTWNKSPGSVGMTHSHEAGHQMGLTHDAVPGRSYYGGHGNWGPIMGAPFGKPYVQWSKGEYPNASNRQDDLSILSSVLGIRADDAGDSKPSANELEATDGTNFMITQDGIAADTDVFSFTLSSPQQISIDVLPTLAVGGEARAANAAFNVGLEDSGGTLLAAITSSDNTPLRPDTNTFSNTATLDADTYYLTVDALSPNTNWATGFGEYGHGGEYRLIVGIDPEITTAIPGSTLTGSTETFSWIDHGNDVNQYEIDVGSTPGGEQYFAGSPLSGNTNSATVTGLPIDGSSVWVRFTWAIPGQEPEFTDYEYTAASVEPSGDPGITAPVAGSTLSGFSETFSWVSNGTDVDQYWVYFGSTEGFYQYGNSGSLSSQTLQYTPTALPTDGSTVFVRFFWKKTGGNAQWMSVDYTYTAAKANGPSFTAPLSGGTLAGVSENFRWADSDSGATDFWLYLGSEAGSREYFNSGLIGNGTTNAIVTFLGNDADDSPSYLPTDGSTVYARLWYRASAANEWLYIDDSFAANTSGGPAMTTPIPGSAVSGTSVTLNWEAGEANVSDWWIYVGTGAGLVDIYNSGRLGTALSASVPMPADGSAVHVTLWFLIDGVWRSSDYVYDSIPDS